MARVFAFVGGGAILAGCVGLAVYVPKRWPEALFLSVFGVAIFGGAFWPKSEQPAAGALEWDVGPYSSGLKLVILLLVAALFGAMAYRTRGVLGGALLLVALACLWGMWPPFRRLLAYLRFGAVELSIDRVPDAAGRRLAGRLTLAAGPRAPHELRVSLVYTNIERIRGGGRGSTLKAGVHWKDTRSFPVLPAGAGQALAFSFDIPAGMLPPGRPGDSGLPASIDFGKTYHQWQLLVEGDVERTFVLPAREA